MKTFTYTGKQTIKATILINKKESDINLVKGQTITLDETNEFVAPLITKGLLIEVAKPVVGPSQISSQQNKED